MSVVYGLSDDGFLPKPLQVLREEMNAALRSAFGASLDLGDRSIFGIVIGIIAERLALLWELLDAINSSQDPDKAIGAALVALCALTGTLKPGARSSTVVLTLFGTPSTRVPAGSRVNATSTGTEFTTDESTDIVAVPAWQATMPYALGARVFGDAVRIYQCIKAGKSGSTGVTGAGDDISDGTVHWKMVQDDVPDHGAVDVSASSTLKGPVTAVAGDITTIVNGVAGWLAVTNLLDATPGRVEASNEELRVLREQELSGEGESTVDALRAKLLAIQNIISVTIFTNEADEVDADGMLRHSVEALIRTTWAPGDPQDQQIYNRLLSCVAAGIVTVGNQKGSAVDSAGNVHTIRFSRPVEVPIYVDVTLVKDPLTYPSDGDSRIKDAIVAFGDAQLAGANVVATRVSAQVFKVSGVLDVPRSGNVGGVRIASTPSPTTDTTVAVGTRQLAVYDTSRITLHTSNGTP